MIFNPLKRRFRSSKPSRGLSLIEAGLTIALALLVITFMAMRSKQAVDDTRAQAAADSMRDFQRFAMLYLGQNRDEILNAALIGENADQYCQIGVDLDGNGGTLTADNEKYTCTIDVSWLKYKRMLPENYPETNSYHQRWVAIYRAVVDDYTVGPSSSQGDIEMLIIGVDNHDYGGGRPSEKLSVDEALLAASLAGGNAGIVPSKDLGPCKLNESCSASGTWKVDLDDFVNTSVLKYAGGRD